MRSAVLAPGDQIEIGEHRFAVEAPGVSTSAQATATPLPGRRETGTSASMASALIPAEAPTPPAHRDLGGVYLLIAAAAALAAALTAFFVYAPKAEHARCGACRGAISRLDSNPWLYCRRALDAC